MLNKRIAKTNKAIQLFLKQTLKNYKSMKKKLKVIWLLAIVFAMASCGSTKVAVERPAAGTQTTITVTTNNPISTEVNPSVEAKYEKGL